MQYNLLAFVPFTILSGLALIAASISLWPTRNRRITPPAQPRPTAEILYFPFRPKQLPANPSSPIRFAADANNAMQKN